MDLSKLKRSSKRDDIPGTVEAFLEDICPACGRKMKQYKKCCGHPTGYVGCSCGYKIIAPSSGSGGTSSAMVQGSTTTGVETVASGDDSLPV